MDFAVWRLASDEASSCRSFCAAFLDARGPAPPCSHLSCSQGSSWRNAGNLRRDARQFALTEVAVRFAGKNARRAAALTCAFIENNRFDERISSRNLHTSAREKIASHAETVADSRAFS
jgi:hypothetical protein